MFTKKTSSLLSSYPSSPFRISYSDDLSDAKVSLTDVLGKLIQKYETASETLEAENTILKQQIITLKGTGAVVTAGTNIATPVLQLERFYSMSDVKNRYIQCCNKESECQS